MKCWIVLVAVFFCAACSEPDSESPGIRLSYTINFKNDAVESKLEGLKWALSYLGATLPDSSFYRHCRPQKGRIISVCFDSLGFSPQALAALTQLSDSLKHTEEYEKKNSIDIGEFIALTIGTSSHYYAITEVSPTLGDFRKKYFSDSERLFPVLASGVSKHHRLLHIHTDSVALNMAFLAEEGVGDLRSGTFKPGLYEVFDLMPNGQLRFAVYDAKGQLTDGSPARFGQVGKPGKCLWCHEQYIQPLFKHTPDVAGHMTETEFTALVQQQTEVINAYRKQLKGGVDFEKDMEHMQMEWLYITYLEPSLQKLAQEWDMEEEELKVIVSAMPAHTRSEFPFLGTLYDRRMFAPFAPYHQNEVPVSVLELKGKEPDYLRKTDAR